MTDKEFDERVLEITGGGTDGAHDAYVGIYGVGEPVVLDGQFTPAQLRKIADLADEYLAQSETDKQT